MKLASQQRAPASGSLRSGADESSDTTLGFHHALALERGVGSGDRIGIDPEHDRELPDSGQLVARFEPSSRDGGSNPALQLRVDWGWVIWIDLKH